MNRHSWLGRRAIQLMVLALVLTPLTALTGTAQAGTSWEQVGVPAGAPCPDVLVIGARGSDEQPQQNGGIDPADYARDTFDGMGINNYTVYTQLHDKFPQLHIAHEGVVYPAEPVLGATPSLLNDPGSFIASAIAGSDWMAREINQIYATCGNHTKFVLTGYSQGAWVVHRVLNQIGSTIRKQVIGVTLFGDALYLPFQSYNRVNNAVNILAGVANGADPGNALIPKDTRAKTYDYCHHVDPICQFGVINLARIDEHMDYVASGDVVAAANSLTMPAPTTWTTLSGNNPPSVNIGTKYSWSQGISGAVGTVIWTLTGDLPPGLKFSSGKLTGAPNKGGFYRFTIKARDSLWRSDSRTYDVTITDPNTPPPPPPPAPLTCASTTTTCTAGWGYDVYGELGDGSVSGASHLPIEGKLLDGVSSVSGGANFTLAIKPDGTVLSVGNNQYGELGNGSTTNSSTPVAVSGLDNVTAVAAGQYAGFALRSDGTVWGWGSNINNALGFGGYGYVTTSPQQEPGLANVKAIAAGWSTAYALLNDGTVWSWGLNYNQNRADATDVQPSQIQGLSGITAIDVSAQSAVVALKSDGTVWSLGDNSHGQLGNGSTTSSISPVQVPGLSGVTQVTSGDSSNFALKSDGTVWSWGQGAGGMLGTGSTSDSPTPVQVSGLSGVSAIDAGWGHTLALKPDGTVWAWGLNGSGQLGNGTMTDTPTPVKVLGLIGVKAIEAGSGYSLAFYNN